MPVTIEIINSFHSEKYEHALFYKKIFEDAIDLDKFYGKILIICNEKLVGYGSKKIDLIIVGDLAGRKDYVCRIKTAANYYSYSGKSASDVSALRNVTVKNFCFTIEVRNDSELDPIINDSYNNSDKNISKSVNDILISEYLNETFEKNPFIFHFVWMKNFEYTEIFEWFKKKCLPIKKYNYLPQDITFKYMLKLACLQKVPNFPVSKRGEIKGYCVFKSLPQAYTFDMIKIESMFKNV